MDQRVEIHGTSRTHVNGKRGVAVDFHPVFMNPGQVSVTDSRYSVKLDSGESFKLKPANVRAERAGRARAGPARKGTGGGGRGAEK